MPTGDDKRNRRPPLRLHLAGYAGVLCVGKRVQTTRQTLSGRHVVDVGILPDGYVRTNPLPQIPTKQSVPTSRERLPGYFGIPMVISTLRNLIGPAIDKV
jgi:hypothetical protein